MYTTEPLPVPDDPEIDRQIGRYIATWNAMEHEVDMLITDLMRTERRVGKIVTANIMLNQKLRLARALFSEFRGLDPIFSVGKSVEDTFDRLVRATDAASEKRNDVAHGLQISFDLSPPRPAMVSLRAKNTGLTGNAFFLGPHAMDEPIAHNLALASEWNALRKTLSHCIKSFSLAHADRILSGVEEEPETWELRNPGDDSSRKSKR